MNDLITQSLQEANVHLLFNFPKQLMSPHEQKMVQWVTDYTARYGSPPTIERLNSEFATFVPVKTRDPLGDTYDRALRKRRNLYVREYMTKIQGELKAGADPLPFIEELHAKIRVGDANVTRYSTYDRSAYHRKGTSYPYDIGVIDQYTGGIAKGDLVYLIGRLGTGKTTFALWCLSKWLTKGRRILMVSNENRADDVIAKIDSYIGGFNPIKKRTMQWSDDDLQRLSTVSFIAAHMEGEVFIPNRPVQTVDEVQNMIYTYKPDIVLVDGIYLIRGVSGESHWEKITNVSRSLKQLAEGEGVPVLGIHQANRQAIGRKIEIEHIAFADALAQDADLVMAINPEDDGTIFVEAIKNRWGDSNWGFFMQFYFETMSVKILDGREKEEDK